MIHTAGMNVKSVMRVKNTYEEFKQFAMQTVSADDIARRFPKATKEESPVVHKVKKNGDFEIPKFGS
jgi:ectoine hydroxylase-related dioxygenase (phytanoyl-CoA dioxygenase family)